MASPITPDSVHPLHWPLIESGPSFQSIHTVSESQSGISRTALSICTRSGWIARYSDVSSSQACAMPPGWSESRVRASSSADSGVDRYQNVAAITSRRSSISSRAAMSTSGTFEPCPFTNRMRRKPWWIRLLPMSTRYSTNRFHSIVIDPGKSMWCGV